MRNFVKYFIYLVLFILIKLSIVSSAYAAITMPEPPPELSDSLKDFRTKEQINLQRAQDSTGLLYSVQNQELKVVSGDIESGVQRYDLRYRPLSIVIVPQFGQAIMRFYDVNGKPWDIRDFEFQNQGFEAQKSAIASELMIKQTLGASSSKLVVRLAQLQMPLVFNIRASKVVNEANKLVLTTISAVNLDVYKDLGEYVMPDIYQFAKVNPLASKIDYSHVNQDELVKNLIDAVILKDE